MDGRHQELVRPLVLTRLNLVPIQDVVGRVLHPLAQRQALAHKGIKIDDSNTKTN